jgi:hypothetical protein
MTIGPSYRHALFDGFALRAQQAAGSIDKDNGTIIYAHIDGAKRFS